MTRVKQLYPCIVCRALPHPVIYFGLNLDQFRKHPTCWLQTFLMGAVNAFQVPAYFSFLSCKVLDQYLSINCTFQPIQQRSCGEKWCSIHIHTLFLFKFTNVCPIDSGLGAKEAPLHVTQFLYKLKGDIAITILTKLLKREGLKKKKSPKQNWEEMIQISEVTNYFKHIKSLLSGSSSLRCARGDRPSSSWPEPT